MRGRCPIKLESDTLRELTAKTGADVLGSQSGANWVDLAGLLKATVEAAAKDNSSSKTSCTMSTLPVGACSGPFLPFGQLLAGVSGAAKTARSSPQGKLPDWRTRGRAR